MQKKKKHYQKRKEKKKKILPSTPFCSRMILLVPVSV